MVGTKGVGVGTVVGVDILVGRCAAICPSSLATRQAIPPAATNPNPAPMRMNVRREIPGLGGVALWGETATVADSTRGKKTASVSCGVLGGCKTGTGGKNSLGETAWLHCSNASANACTPGKRC